MAARTQRFDERQHMRNHSFEVFRYKGDYPKDVTLHHHDFYEIYFFLSGNVQYNIETRSYYLAPGNVLLIGPNELHQPVFGERRQSYERFVLWIDKRFLESLEMGEMDLKACFDTSAPSHTNLLAVEGLQRQLLTFELEQMIQTLEVGDEYAYIHAMSYLVQVLVLLNRQARQQQPRKELREVPDSAVYSVLSYINDHYSEELTLDFLANRFFISKYHLSREFGRLVGTSVHRYITQKRLVMAKQMISDGLPATEVCQHCGFGDYSNFYRSFKAEYRISPKEFAARLKQSAAQESERTRKLRALQGQELAERRG